MKEALKNRLLDAGLYYKINAFRFRNDPRNIAQKAFYANLIGKDDLVFDVGANVGQRAELFSQLAGRVIAFEPQADCVRHLKSRFRMRDNVTIEQIALSDREGEALFYESSSHTLSSMSRKFINTVSKERFKEHHWDEEIKVKTTTLDRMIAIYGRPKFIKIDVEGFEASVFGGLTETVPYISFEYTPELIGEANACVRRINKISERYVYNYCYGEDLNFVLKKHADYVSFSTTVLSVLGQQDQFGDIYAILSHG